MRPALLAGCLFAALLMTVVFIGCGGKGEEAETADSQGSPMAKGPGGAGGPGGPGAGGPGAGGPAGAGPQQAEEETADEAAKPAQAAVTEVWAEAIPPGWVVSPENAKHIGEAGYRILHEASGIEMVYVPAGTTTIGPAESTGNGDDAPAHKVALGGFWIGLSEVTVGQWRAVMGSVPDGNDRSTAAAAAEGDADDAGDQGAGDEEGAAAATTAPPDEFPVVGITWAEARRLCETLSMRLPTEAEWEYAARWAEGSKYPWGNVWDVEKCVCGASGPNAVGQLAGAGQDVSWCGAVDMAGNVREWCADWYGADYYAKSPAKAPTGPDERDATSVPFVGKCRVVRGGSYMEFSPELFRRQARGAVSPAYRGLNIGLRCAADFVLIQAAEPAAS